MGASVNYAALLLSLFRGTIVCKDCGAYGDDLKADCIQRVLAEYAKGVEKEMETRVLAADPERNILLITFPPEATHEQAEEFVRASGEQIRSLGVKCPIIYVGSHSQLQSLDAEQMAKLGWVRKEK